MVLENLVGIQRSQAKECWAEHINSTQAQERDGGFGELQGRLEDNEPRPEHRQMIVKLHVDDELPQLGEVVGDRVEGADYTEHVWLSCQLESRDPDKPS